MVWPFNSSFYTSRTRTSQSRDWNGWDRYRLLPTSDSGASGSGSSRESTSKEWESTHDSNPSYFNSNSTLKEQDSLERQDLEEEEDDSLLPFSSGSHGYSNSKNRFNSLLHSTISFILISTSKFKRLQLYIKLILCSIFICLTYLTVSSLFFKGSNSEKGSIFENPDQALQLLRSLTSISTSDSLQDPTRVVFKDHSPGLSSTRIVPIQQYEQISDKCLESWISKGEWNLKQDCSNGLKNEIESVHAVVNGSDLVQISSRHLFRPDGPLKMDSSHRYGDHNELLYSMRSFRSSLKKGDEIWRRQNGQPAQDVGFGLKKMHVLASAYPLDYQIEYIQKSLEDAGLSDQGIDLEDSDKDKDSLNDLIENHRVHREPTPSDLLERSNSGEKATFGIGSLGKDRTLSGQLPRWLEKSTTSGRGIEIEVHYDSEYFAPLPSSPEHIPSDAEVEEWRERVIPTFNSLAVESQIYNLPTDPSSSPADAIVYLNDDFFTLLPSSVSDYNSPLYGTVIKSLPRITSMYWPSENPIWRLWNPAGEEVGIKRAAWQLGQRFPMRAYPYITHHPRSLSLPLLREAAQTFPQAFGDTALSRFRAQQDVPVSIQAVFLASWYIVQRHREALLWSWSVAKWGGLDGQIDQSKRDQMWNELTRFQGRSRKERSNGDLINPKKSFQVLKPVRSPISESSKESLSNAGLQPPLTTEYDFSSQDGYALSYLDHLWFWQRKNKNGLPDLSSPPSSRTKLCTLKKDKCLGSSGKVEDASEFFKRISFEDQDCGDCIIPALISASGEKGLEAFLPHAESKIPNEDEFDQVEEELKMKNQKDANLWELEIEHLPLTQDWKTTDFKLKSIIRPRIQSSSAEIFQNPKSESKAFTQNLAFEQSPRKFKRSRSLRNWTMRLIHRYSYVLGTAESELYQMKWTDKVEKRLKDLDSNQGEFTKMEHWLDQDSSSKKGNNKDSKPLTFLALNDDLKEEDQTEKLNSIVGKWFEGRWPQRETRMPDERRSSEL